MPQPRSHSALPNKTKTATRSITESLAIAFMSSDWSSSQMSLAGQAIFTKRQAWIPDLVKQVRQWLPDRPTLQRLIGTLNAKTELPDLLKRRNLKKVNLGRLLKQRSPVSVQWFVPIFESTGELASHLGISPRQLDWLSYQSGDPDRRPQHYDYRWIKKRSVGYRLVESPKFLLKQTQRLILDDVLRHIPTHHCAHGFCRRRSVLTFVEQHIGKRFCLKMDLKDFFPSIQGGRVFGLLRSVGLTREVAQSITRLSTNPTPASIIEPMRPTGSRGSFESSLLYGPAHLPQGAPTSPMLANLIAFRMDCRLTGVAESAGAFYSRYADDLLFSGDRKFAKASKTFATTVATIAIEEGFKVNFRKTRFLNHSQRQMAAGIMINQRPNTERRKFDNLKTTLYNCVKRGAASLNRENHPNFRASLAGQIAWVSQLNPLRGQRLLDLFNNVDW